jgi:formylglycine-generating enzyme required for sulfatase activity
LRYRDREQREEQDWTRFPVSAISLEDAIEYAAWLDRTGRIRNARVCTEYEWERAARGADGRTFPSGAALSGLDANIDATYGRVSGAFGPDVVGLYPRSRSPIGAEDMAGNVWELTRSVEKDGVPVHRGGGWYTGALSARSTNRDSSTPTMRYSAVGLRLCATPL